MKRELSLGRGVLAFYLHTAEDRAKVADRLNESMDRLNKQMDRRAKMTDRFTYSRIKRRLRLKIVDLSHTALNLKSYQYVDLTLFRKTLH